MAIDYLVFHGSKMILHGVYIMKEDRLDSFASIF